MLMHLSPRERLGYFAIACLALFGMGFGGAKYLERPAPIVMHASSAQGSGEVVVHVVGAVKNPGVYSFSRGARVSDAIAEAGGAHPDAELSSLNLAQALEDGLKLTVPGRATTPQAKPVPDSEAAPDSETVPTPAAGGPILSLNSASEAELDTLPGVGPVTARAIIEYRTQMGGFQSVDELVNVKGIGDKKLAKMKPYLRL